MWIVNLRTERAPGLGRVARVMAVIAAAAALVAVVVTMSPRFASAPRPALVPTPAPVFQLCADGNDDRMDDRDSGNDGYDDSMRDDEWTQGAGIMDLWRVERTWRRAAAALRASNVAPVTLTPQAFDPQQRWLRIPGLPNTKLRQAESSTLDIFKLGDTIYAWSGDRWYRSDKAATAGFRPAEPKELPYELQSVPARNWHRYPQEWVEKSAEVVLPMGQPGVAGGVSS